MIWHQLRAAVGWMPLAFGVAALLAGVGGLELAARCTPEAQRLTLQELLDGKAGENRHVAITDFRPYDRYVLKRIHLKSGKDGGYRIGYIGVQPVLPEAGARSPGPPRALIASPECNERSFADWSQRQTISGILENPDKEDEQLLRETYPGIDLPSCRILHEGRKPSRVRESWTCLVIGAFGVALGGWMLYPGLIPFVWKRLRGVKTLRPAGRQNHEAVTRTSLGPPAPRGPVTAPPAIGRGESRPTPKAPLPDRILAVAYVLSLAVQPIGFFLLAGIGSFLWVERGLDSMVLGFWLGGIGCFVSCIAFRWWVRR